MEGLHVIGWETCKHVRLLVKICPFPSITSVIGSDFDAILVFSGIRGEQYSPEFSHVKYICVSVYVYFHTYNISSSSRWFGIFELRLCTHDSKNYGHDSKNGPSYTRSILIYKMVLSAKIGHFKFLNNKFTALRPMLHNLKKNKKKKNESFAVCRRNFCKKKEKKPWQYQYARFV